MTKRFYSGARTGKKELGEAARLKKLEIEMGGKLPLTNQERYKRILKKKLQESQAQAQGGRPVFQMPGAAPVNRRMSKKAEQALKEISQRKAAKEEKALRQMVVVKPRHFANAGRIDAKGKAYDLGNNLTLKVDLKTGKIKTNTGWTVGKYKPRKTYLTNMLLTDALQKHGAYFIQQRKLQLLEQQRLAELAMQGMNVHGVAGTEYGMASQIFLEQHYGSQVDAHGNSANHHLQENRVNAANVGAWGAMSNNVHGTYVDNAWGGMADNVWGGTNNNIWGGLGGSPFGRGGAWGHRGLKIWGSGAPGQKNYLKPLGALFVGLFGFGKGKRLGLPLRGRGRGQVRARSR